MTPKRLSSRVARGTLAAFAVIIALGAAGAGWWGTHPLGPASGAIAALTTDGSVRVTQAADGWEFAPVGSEPTSALVFYPGGHVDARSYAPYARGGRARLSRDRPGDAPVARRTRA